MVQLLYKSVFYLIRNSVSLSHNIRTIFPIRSLAFSMLLSLPNGQRYCVLSLTRDNDAIKSVVVAEIRIS